MSIAESRLIFVETRAGLYRQQVESETESENDGADAVQSSKPVIACFDLVDLIAQGANLFDSINRLDNDWRMLVYSKVVPYREAFERRIEKLYSNWLEASERVIVLYTKLEAEYKARGFDVDLAEKLLAAIREARGTLTPDDKFFSHQKLVDLRDAAIDESRSGEAFPV
ncbi:MAG TPA: hypothetical protein VHV55_15150 [Pirellulales bacterium]|jgi:hypothetical protein|nr:hypothetical protein [Pirellulales bacterium]